MTPVARFIFLSISLIEGTDWFLLTSVGTGLSHRPSKVIMKPVARDNWPLLSVSG